MSRAFIVLDCQHQGRLSRLADRGATAPDYTEVDVIRDYAAAADRTLRGRVDVALLSHGEYAERHAWVNRAAPAAYIACHVNAGIDGRGDRGLVFHWPGSVAGARLARQLAAALGPALGWPCAALPADDAWSNVRATIAGARPPAVCLEPGFIDGRRGRAALADPAIRAALGAALGHGVLAWLAEAP